MRNLNINTYNNMHSMHNYYNIIPVILIDVIIILVFEGLVFFLYLAKEQEHTINNEVSGALNINRTTGTGLMKIGEDSLDIIMKKSMDNEEQYINKEYTNGVIYYICMVIGILIVLCIYVYFVYKKLHKHIDWKSIFCIVLITFVLIMLLEGLFIKFVLFNKKFNGKQLKLDFYNAMKT